MAAISILKLRHILLLLEARYNEIMDKT
jgi:hypothetical protein